VCAIVFELCCPWFPSWCAWRCVRCVSCAVFAFVCVLLCLCCVVQGFCVYVCVLLCLYCGVSGFRVYARAVVFVLRCSWFLNLCACCVLSVVSAFVRVQLCLCCAVHDHLSLLHGHLAPSGFAWAPCHFASEVSFICPVVACANICKTQMQFQTNSPQLHAHAFILSDTRCNTLVKSFSSARACKHWRLHVRFYLGLYTNNHTPIAFVMFGKSVGDISRKNNKGVLDRPWTTQRVLKAISSTLKFEFTVNPDSWRFDVRQKIGDTGPIKLRTIFPHTSVLSKPTNCHMGSTNQVFHGTTVFSRFTSKCLGEPWNYLGDIVYYL